MAEWLALSNRRSGDSWLLVPSTDRNRNFSTLLCHFWFVCEDSSDDFPRPFRPDRMMMMMMMMMTMMIKRLGMAPVSILMAKKKKI